MTRTRRLQGSLAILAGGWLLASSAGAAAPQVCTQAPGFYRMVLGDFEITALNDGTSDLKPKDLLTSTPPARVESLQAHSHEGDAVPTSVDAYLTHKGNRLVLVDTGAARHFGPTLGKPLAGLQAAGYRPGGLRVG